MFFLKRSVRFGSRLCGNSARWSRGRQPAVNFAELLPAGTNSRVEAIGGALGLCVSSMRAKGDSKRAYAPTICIAFIVFVNPRMLMTLLRL